MSDRPLRSQEWFGAEGRNGFIHRSWMRNQGFADDVFDGRPVIGIATTWSELTPCNAHLRDLAESVKRGVWESGGLPLEFPAMSLGEPLMRPTTMLYRNLLAMEAEELIRANPLDGVVLLSGCDKTTPGLLMGAASVDLPSLMVTGGPMLNGKFRGRDIGSGTDVWRFTEEMRAGRMTAADCAEAEVCMSRSRGHCMTMGTASTMACVAEALGVQLPGAAAIPAVDSRRYALAQAAGRRIVAMVEEDQRLSTVLTRDAFENAIRVNAAIGGSTNAVVHLLAIAGRLGVPLTLEDFDTLTAEVPMLVNLMPSGTYLMEDFAYAGGLPAVMQEIASLLHTDHVTVSGKSVADNISGVQCWNREVIGTMEKPFQAAGSGTVVLRGSLAPSGAVLKVSAASPHLLQHTGPALVFDRIEDYVAAADDPDMDVTADTVIVVQNAGPRGYPGFPEVGNMPMPRRLLTEGVTDMVRISDARMSGTGYGTCVLHVAPEASVGGPLAFVRTGDLVRVDVPARSLDLLVDDAELERRRAAWKPPQPAATRGWARLYSEHVLQADEGADLDFLVGGSGSAPPRHSH
ncbi:IlvD/Edd family dehydratase [Microbispora bryophytorum]|uniref:Dihydroxy-acid dehydratase n=1 Tax=Microbispora bryophytorum subsp. camponoti TaxID=1677852 RepID=A0ABR8LCU8_9ACTN|nr:IlvD/Edd family dehydratase [Microbispora camponoti]MBD3148046.1 dihydroxy-acid dehydratase [Microbispora camponoti]